MTEQKFNAIRARYVKATERLEAFEDVLRRKYGQTRPPASWITRGEEQKRESIYAAQSKASDAMFALLDAISPRNWHTGVAWWWVMEKLTYADATTDGPLSVIPQPGYGTTQREVERFAGVV